VPQQPATPERVLRALHAKAAGTDGPRQDGKTVIFDEDVSVMTLADESSIFRDVIGV
jgi:hypothetical protein